MKSLEVNLYKADQVAELKEERANIQETLTDPFLRKKVSKPVDMQKRVKSIDNLLSAYAPEPLTGKEKDHLKKVSDELEAKIKVGMPTEEVMRKNPVGAVNAHTMWEQHNKPDILRWKNVQRQLNPDSTDPDLANVERLRPHGQMDRMRTDAQIGGVMTYGNVPNENWEQVFDSKPDSALEQSIRAQKKREQFEGVRMDAPRNAPETPVSE